MDLVLHEKSLVYTMEALDEVKSVICLSKPETELKPREVCNHWGQGGLETNENILSTLQALVESTCHLPANNRLGTFQMFLQVPGQTHDAGTFMEHFECNINMCNTFDPP